MTTNEMVHALVKIITEGMGKILCPECKKEMNKFLVNTIRLLEDELYVRKN